MKGSISSVAPRDTELAEELGLLAHQQNLDPATPAHFPLAAETVVHSTDDQTPPLRSWCLALQSDGKVASMLEPGQAQPAQLLVDEIRSRRIRLVAPSTRSRAVSRCYSSRMTCRRHCMWIRSCAWATSLRQQARKDSMVSRLAVKGARHERSYGQLCRGPCSGRQSGRRRKGAAHDAACIGAVRDRDERALARFPKSVEDGLRAIGIAAAVGTVRQADIVAVAQGRLVPATYVKIVQPAEAGIVREIRVREGERVQEGQVLIRLDPNSRLISFRSTGCWRGRFGP